MLYPSKNNFVSEQNVEFSETRLSATIESWDWFYCTMVDVANHQVDGISPPALSHSLWCDGYYLSPTEFSSVRHFLHLLYYPPSISTETLLDEMFGAVGSLIDFFGHIESGRLVMSFRTYLPLFLSPTHCKDTATNDKYTYNHVSPSGHPAQ